MASKKNFHSRVASSYFLKPAESGNNNNNNNHPIKTTSAGSFLEFDESDIWNSSSATPPAVEMTRKMLPSSSRTPKNKIAKNNYINEAAGLQPAATVITCASMPVNIPDWSQIYKGDQSWEHHHQRKEGGDCSFEDDTEFDDDDMMITEDQVPPHEFLARRRGASFSVHEGIGRTLKGRDLRQVRNAIWKKVGFED